MSNEPKKYTVEEFRTYLQSKDSMGDIFYYLSEENIDKALSADTKEDFPDDDSLPIDSSEYNPWQ